MEGTKQKRKANSDGIWFFITIIYIILDYGRIYQLIGIGFLRPLMITTLILICFILGSDKYGFAKSKQTSLLWMFALLLICYIPFSRNNYWAYITAKSQILYMPFIISLIICVSSIQRLTKFIIICVLLEIYVAFYAILNGGVGPGNYFADENDVALYINMWLPFCYFLLFTRRGLFQLIILILGLVVGILAIIVSFSRGGFVGLITIGFIAWLYSTKKLLTTIIFVIMIVGMFVMVDKAYWAEISTVTDLSENTAYERIESWKAAWRMFLDNPFGVGGHNFEVRFPEYQGDNFERNMWGRVSHSLWFTLLSELGIIGVCIFFLLLYENVKDIFWLKRQNFESMPKVDQVFFHYLGIGFLTSLVGFFVTATFLSVLYYAHYWYMTALIVATVKVAKMNCQCSQRSA